MRRKRQWAFAAGIVWLGMLCVLAAAQAQETICLRVIGRDDTAAGQAEKIRVRDAVLAVCPPSWTDPEQLRAAADRAARAVADCRTEVRIWQPEGGAPVRTLYVTVGAGRGRNWWGILYGNALSMAAEEESGEEALLVWSFWDWLRGFLGL